MISFSLAVRHIIFLEDSHTDLYLTLCSAKVRLKSTFTPTKSMAGAHEPSPRVREVILSDPLDLANVSGAGTDLGSSDSAKTRQALDCACRTICQFCRESFILPAHVHVLIQAAERTAMRLPGFLSESSPLGSAEGRNFNDTHALSDSALAE